jgi:saccharopine dehydrogenase-like NADP-dependent oxidoreductase
MKDVVVIGVWKIGATAARLVASTDDYRVTLDDSTQCPTLSRVGCWRR